ncbi:putative negative regulator [Klebsiella oxytoca]|nr:putative negative regulator [Klebsiella oxytoca]
MKGSPDYSTDWVSAIGESMMKLKDKMTPAELAESLNLARQTINRWAREQKWRTEPIPGVKGGRARLIVIDRPVIDFLANIPALRHLAIDNQLAEQPVKLIA